MDSKRQFAAVATTFFLTSTRESIGHKASGPETEGSICVLTGKMLFTISMLLEKERCSDLADGMFHTSVLYVSHVYLENSS